MKVLAKSLGTRCKKVKRKRARQLVMESSKKTMSREVAVVLLRVVRLIGGWKSRQILVSIHLVDIRLLENYVRMAVIH
jgi:hypothetical protein